MSRQKSCSLGISERTSEQRQMSGKQRSFRQPWSGGEEPQRERHERGLQKSSRFGEKMLNLEGRTLRSFKGFEAGE